MTAPNIEAIAASLRNCSLGGSAEAPEQQQTAAGDRRPPVEEQTGENVGVTVELNSEVALPYHWEQCLDMRTGEVYYINWKDGTRTSVDPRLTTTLCRTNYYSSKDNISEDDGGEAEEDEDDDDDYCDAEDSSSSDGEGTDCEDFYGVKTSSSSCVGSPPSSESQRADPGAGEHVLVAAGCKSCFMYFMVSKRVEACPKCGGCLLHLGRNGYF